MGFQAKYWQVRAAGFGKDGSYRDYGFHTIADAKKAIKDWDRSVYQKVEIFGMVAPGGPVEVIYSNTAKEAK